MADNAAILEHLSAWFRDTHPGVTHFEMYTDHIGCWDIGQVRLTDGTQTTLSSRPMDESVHALDTSTDQQAAAWWQQYTDLTGPEIWVPVHHIEEAS